MTTVKTNQAMAQLGKVLVSPEFKRSKRLRQFLSYVVEETLNGRSESIKQYTIALEGLGFGPDFNPEGNPCVRILAGRLRRALSQYYYSRGGKDPVRIDIPKGSYVPEFITGPEMIREATLDSEPISPISARIDSEFARPDGPSLAILPYEYVGNGSNHEYIANGITEEILIGLTRFQDFFVVGPLNRDIIRQRNLGPRTIGLEYNVRFLLEGTVRMQDRALRLTTRLTDTVTGRKIWGQIYDHDIDKVSLEQVEIEIVGSIVASIADNFGVIPRTMAYEVSHQHNDSRSDYAAILKFHHHVRVLNEKSLSDAIYALEELIQRNPDHDLAMALLGDLVSTPYWLGYTDSLTDLDRAAELGKRALALNPNSQPAHMTMAINYYLRFQKELCLNEIEQTLRLNPNNANYLANSALFLMGIGQREEGLAVIDRAMRWNPHHPGWYHIVPFLYHYSRGEFTTALVNANGFNTPDYFWDPLIRTAVLGQLGHRKDAQKSAEELLALVPDFETRGSSLIHRMLFQGVSVEMVLDGLDKAGLIIAQHTI